jgi:hypothetical protein
MVETLVEGTVHICWKDPLKAHRETLASFNCEDFVARTGDPRQPLAFDKLPILNYYSGGKKFHPKDYLSVDVVSTVGTTIHYAQGSPAGLSKIEIPCTAWNTRTGGKTYPIKVAGRAGNFLMLWNTVATYETIVLAKRAELASYQVEDGLRFVLGHANAFNSRILIYLQTHT